MSDDFDKLRPTGDDDESEDESLDWKKDDKKKSGGASSGESLGFTGELNWRKDVEDAFGQQLDATSEDAFDWQQGEQTDSSGQAASGFGFTGQLDWKKVQPGGDSSGASEDESMDWLRSADEMPESSSDISEQPPPAEPPLPAFPDENDDIIPADADDSMAWLNQF